MTSSLQSYTYLHPSAVRASAGGRTLALETSGGATPAGAAAHPHFFSGFLTAPTAAAAALLAVADVAATRYYRPAAPASLDPVVTADGDRLRMESFSGCCGVYARLDVLAPGLDGDDIGHGTTNVDINLPLRRALAALGGLDPLQLTVGPEELEVRTFDGRFVEKRVPLPERWLRGFAEAQVLAAGFTLRAEVPAAEAAAVLRALPRSGAAGRTTRWLMPAGRTLRPTSRPAPGAVCLPGPDRLLTLRQVLRHATTLRIYAPDLTEGQATAVAWELALPGMRLTLLLSQDAARGFSGEGGVLYDLVGGPAADDADLVSALLAWEPRVEVSELSRLANLSPERVRAALTVLGTSGQIGYDLAEEAYFPRQLPYSAGAVETRNPRLRGARALVADDAVRLDGALTRVGRGDQVHLVRADDAGELSCTCLWWAKYRDGRGPCTHVLAARMVRDETTEAAL
ncbi:SWIM zinc finger family protein [Streptomyces sp. MBT65]|uniref:SWIM zinc finger family protein n=1 Tax=Streptomyces sp. MBT65 TaxID=1488395 RepID=UPI00190DC60F|nr:SWIM zinc finger family protein [Streptomyces sp. MBT65]MBK3577101.1 SWIM zinc finger family protein [Streptomyces sp. MBT65]